MREEILYKKSKTGTVVIYFDNLLPKLVEGQNYGYVVLNQQNQPMQITTTDGENNLLRIFGSNNFIKAEDANYNILTGTVFTRTFDYIIPDSKKEAIKNSFLKEMNLQNSGQSISYVVFEDQKVDDLFIDVCLERTYNTIDTLKIYNNLIDSFPDQESNTGTVFGKLEAIQKIKDINENNIKIPLKNVPVGIFQSSTEYPETFSVDDNGNRISLNLLESSVVNQYFNEESYLENNNVLLSGAKYSGVPQHYQYVTFTNDNGEFTIHNVPVGTQTLFFEVDLFKQGLTKDEIELNFFNFPQEKNPIIDNFPSIFYRELTIDVVPTWGSFQTGYTEVNIKANLDLRKWSTFVIPPVNIDGKKIDFLYSRGQYIPLTLEVRDMSLTGFPIKSTEIVEIPNSRSKKTEHQLYWENEFRQLKKKVEFAQTSWNVFKVPANIYDPYGYKTDKEGNITNSRGVWLAGYQFALFYKNINIANRTTGSRKVIFNNKEITRSHFNLNRNIDNFDLNQLETNSLGVGIFPYERKWDSFYPERYSIPKRPFQGNPELYDLSNSNKLYGDIPKYLDGDLIGEQYIEFVENDGTGTGGLGVSVDINNSKKFKTFFSKIITKNLLYKYESSDNIFDSYANGYLPNKKTFLISNSSSVLNGEKFQRVECGYGYLLFPEGMHRVIHQPYYGDLIFEKDLKNPNAELSNVNSSTDTLDFIFNHKNSMSINFDEEGQKENLELGSNSSIKEGSLNIYRIIDSGDNLNPLTLNETRVFVRANFSTIRVQNAYTTTQNTKFSHGDDQEKFRTWGDEMRIDVRNSVKIRIVNQGVKSSEIKFLGGSSFYLEPGQEIQLLEFETGLISFNEMLLDLEANADFNYESGFFQKAKYLIEFKDVKFFANNDSPTLKDLRTFSIIPLNLNSSIDNTVDYYLVSRSISVSVRSNLLGNQTCGGNYFNLDTTIDMNGILLDGYKDKKYHLGLFTENPLTDFTCTEDTGYKIP